MNAEKIHDYLTQARRKMKYYRVMSFPSRHRRLRLSARERKRNRLSSLPQGTLEGETKERTSLS
jgi:hypothetical protein